MPGLLGGLAIEACSADWDGACCQTCWEDPLACHFLDALGQNMAKTLVVVEEFCFHFGWWIVLKFLCEALCLLRTFKAKVDLLGFSIIGLERWFLLFLGKLHQRQFLVNSYGVALGEGVLSL